VTKKKKETSASTRKKKTLSKQKAKQTDFVVIALGMNVMLCAKTSGIARGQTWQVRVGRKCIAKSCFDLQKKRFWGEINVFLRYFIENGFGHCGYLVIHLNNSV